MIINTYLYKNKKLIKKHLNINARYDKNVHRLEFNEKNSLIQVTFDENQIEYIRNNKEYVFKIKKLNESSEASIEIEGKEFIINVIECFYKKETQKIYLTYIIETDVENENEIIIEFLNI